MKSNNYSDIIHIENDVMIYDNLDNLKDKFNKDKIYLLFDNTDRVIPGIIYINNYSNLKIILDNYDMKDNDMVNLGKYFNSSFIEPFPIISIDSDEEKFDELKKYLSEITQGRFQWFLDNREEPEVMSEVLKKIAEMLYNERGIIDD